MRWQAEQAGDELVALDAACACAEEVASEDRTPRNWDQVKSATGFLWCGLVRLPIRELSVAGADPMDTVVGDDEHGMEWDVNGFEAAGGCDERATKGFSRVAVGMPSRWGQIVGVLRGSSQIWSAESWGEVSPDTEVIGTVGTASGGLVPWSGDGEGGFEGLKGFREVVVGGRATVVGNPEELNHDFGWPCGKRRMLQAPSWMPGYEVEMASASSTKTRLEMVRVWVPCGCWLAVSDMDGVSVTLLLSYEDIHAVANVHDRQYGALTEAEFTDATVEPSKGCVGVNLAGSKKMGHELARKGGHTEFVL
ncbi:hypothetical protein H257_13195 [Aphanomyces astaci]|uniref:Uncharacterized protein n=1 Tax=Aphanomyces astaci TaxID=112090 RepID=W4FVK9_APHAT|nr:hypothetical protein H257_13195 [Aphanomyces astaci]ETV71532.1 hypothetical protein H257_13195 [Aphanomyces astaci]|eukprot:XP_009838965.1 hypothetical protein H257_13195 [Aphanomyces astaci]